MSYEARRPSPGPAAAAVGGAAASALGAPLRIDVRGPRLEAVADAWADAECDAAAALHAWRGAAPPERANAYLVYRAALDREAQAAHVYAAAAEVRR